MDSVEQAELARGGSIPESPRSSHRGRLSEYLAGLIMGFCVLLIATLLLGPLAGLLTLAALIVVAEVKAARRGQG
jgi:hypothetical protein